MPYSDPEKRRLAKSKWKGENPEYQEGYRDGHKEAYTEYIRTYRQRQRARIDKWFSEYKSLMRCVVCSESHEACLDFHHRKPEDKRFAVKQMMRKGTCPLETILIEVSKCDILCANCHRKHHWAEREKSKKRKK